MSAHGAERDPYAVLGVSPDATQREISSAYRRLVRGLHPDGPDGDSGKLGEVVDAYERLRDPGRRTEHDRARHAGTRRARRTGPEPTEVPVRVHRTPRQPEPDVRAGPVRRHR
ncbi:J domain-containing protein [Haloechinothrix sp. YIM 98757]|uniref:J domain-containing protein n=1 Tax=Haloechinothrix aidingensis TaxID=2752311 RepID=A0A838A9B2_9PSEU|nr:J domain-containing protein [Haloechinothrix aidingensis]MBA0125182.1 J domain-containing protein [Haloechinothrix aidingensis]